MAMFGMWDMRWLSLGPAPTGPAVPSARVLLSIPGVVAVGTLALHSPNLGPYLFLPYLGRV